MNSYSSAEGTISNSKNQTDCIQNIISIKLFIIHLGIWWLVIGCYLEFDIYYFGYLDYDQYDVIWVLWLKWLTILQENCKLFNVKNAEGGFIKFQPSLIGLFFLWRIWTYSTNYRESASFKSHNKGTKKQLRMKRNPAVLWKK